MAGSIVINAKTTAVLAMDFQNRIVEGYAADKDALLARVTKLLDAARAAGVLVIYVVVGFRPGFPEISARNKSFSALRQNGSFAPGDASTAIHPALTPRDGDLVVTKHRVGAFSGTDMEMILKAHDIDTLVLTGIATSGVVLSTLRHAADADYALIVAGDCCADRDPEVHRVLTEKVFPRQAEIVTADDLLKSLA